MLIYYNEKIVDEFYHEDLINSIDSNFSDDFFDDDNNLHLDLPEDYQLFESLKHLNGTFLSEEDL